MLRRRSDGKYGHFSYPKVKFKLSSSILLVTDSIALLLNFSRRVLGLIYKVGCLVRTCEQRKVTLFGNLRAILKFAKNSCVHLRASVPLACHLRGTCMACVSFAWLAWLLRALKEVPTGNILS